MRTTNPTVRADQVARRTMHRGRALLVLSLLLALAGALSAATVARQLGGVALVAGWGLSLVALHRFGRQSAAAPPPASDLAAEDGDPDSRA